MHLDFLRVLKMLLHIIGSVLGSDPGRAGSNPAGATIEIVHQAALLIQASG